MAKIEGDPNRPALSDTRSFLELMERRDPWYRQAADLVLDRSPLRKSEIAQEILDWFRTCQGLGRSSKANDAAIAARTARAAQ